MGGGSSGPGLVGPGAVRGRDWRAVEPARAVPAGVAGPHPAGCSALGSGSGGRAGPGARGGAEGRVGCSLNSDSFLIIFSSVIIFFITLS